MPSALREDTDGAGGDDGAASRLVATVAPFLSIRTAFDLYLKALDLPRGSRVICSALTIPHMVDIFEEHGLVPVPVDLDPDTLAPEAGALEAELERRHPRGRGERRVRAIYMAHVFGAQVDMTPVAELAKRHGLLLWEDCAQVFTGLQGYLGHTDSDALFFSFGVIKRASALGGGVVRIKDTAILSAMMREEAGYPAQSASTYLRRVVKCSLLLGCTSPLLYGVIVHALRLVGVDHDKVVMKLSKGFPKDGLLKAIRHRPSVPLLQMLVWRISRYTPDGVEVRLRHCNRMLALLEAALPQQPQLQQRSQPRPQKGLGGSQNPARENIFEVLPGMRAHRHTLWLCPVMVKGGLEAADLLVEELLREGFDATRAPTSLMPIERCTTAGRQAPSSSASPCATPRCSGMMDSLVYLPLSNNVPDSEVDRMALALARALSSGSVVRQEERHRAGAGPLPRRGKRRSKAARSLMAFALRLDVVVVSAASAMLFMLLVLLARLLL